MSRGAVVMVVAGLVALGMVALPGPAGGQVARHPSEIPEHLAASARYLRQAFQHLDDRAQAERMTFEGYVQLRDVLAKMQNANAVMKFPNPLYDIADPKRHVARQRILEAYAASRGPGWGAQDRLDATRSRLEEAVRVIETVLPTTF